MTNTMAIALAYLLAQCSMAAFVGCNGGHNSPSSQINRPLPVKQEANTSMNDYEPIPLPRLIGMADHILAGTVQSVEKETFFFKVEDVLGGETTKELISVAQFIPNQFDGPRETPYQAGQHFLIFLKMDTAQNVLRILGAGGEGEMPVEDGFVYFPGRHVDGLEMKNYRVQQTARAIQRYEHKTFSDAVKDFRKCYHCQFDVAEERYKCHKSCEPTEFQRLAGKSFIHKYLVERAN